MPIKYDHTTYKPNWHETKKAQILNFVCGEDIPAKAFIVRDLIDPHVCFVWNGKGCASGYNPARRSFKTGDRIDIVMNGYDIECETGGGSSVFTSLGKFCIPANDELQIFSINKYEFRCSELLVCFSAVDLSKYRVLKVVAVWDEVQSYETVHANIGNLNIEINTLIQGIEFTFTIKNNESFEVCAEISRQLL